MINKLNSKLNELQLRNLKCFAHKLIYLFKNRCFNSFFRQLIKGIHNQSF